MVLKKFQRIYLGKLSCYGIGKIPEDLFGQAKLLWYWQDLGDSFLKTYV